MPTIWSPGDQILFRYLWEGKVSAVLAMTVVLDTPELLALYTAAGTPGVVWEGYLDRSQSRFPPAVEKWPMRETQWKWNHVLRLITPSADHSIWLMWKEKTWELSCWYVNLEEPAVRTPLGVDSTDQQLDIVISPDLKSWRWKDEDHLAEAQEMGFISGRRARELRADGRRVIAAMEAREPPFDQPWPDWRPDPSWPIPELPQGWAKA